MSKIWKTFNFAPMAFIHPRDAEWGDLENFFEYTLAEYIVDENGDAVEETVRDIMRHLENKANEYSSPLFVNGKDVQFAVGLCRRVEMPVTAEQVYNGFGLPEEPPFIDITRAFTRELRAVLEFYAPAFTRAMAAFNALDLDATSKSSYSNENSGQSSGAVRNKISAGMQNTSTSKPTAVTETSGSSSNSTTGATTTKDTAALIEVVKQFNDGELKNPLFSFIDALFEHLFEPFEQRRDVYVFGDISFNIWG